MKLVYGNGVNDTNISGPAAYRRDGRLIHYPEYEMWKGMLLRSFSQREKVRRPACVDSLCCEDWKLRSNFQRWYFSFTEHLANDGSKLHLDKDLLFIGNNLYSPETCCLIPNYLNLSIRDGTRTDVPWVRYVQKPDMVNPLKKPWRASVYNEGKHIELGMFSTQAEGHYFAQICKANVLETSVLPRYVEEKSVNNSVVEALILRVDLLRQQAKSGEISRFC